MTPEILNESNILIIKIKAAMRPIKEIERKLAQKYTEVHISNNDGYGSIPFELKPEQVEIVKVLVLSMANQNLAEMTAEFEAL